MSQSTSRVIIALCMAGLKSGIISEAEVAELKRILADAVAKNKNKKAA